MDMGFSYVESRGLSKKLPVAEACVTLSAAMHGVHYDRNIITHRPPLSSRFIKCHGFGEAFGVFHTDLKWQL
jgi:hypothetical protein